MPHMDTEARAQKNDIYRKNRFEDHKDN